MATKRIESKLQVLLIDDEESVRQAVGGGLENMGFAVLRAESAEEGLRLFEKERVDIIITDIRMPGMDGLEFVRRIRQISQEIDIILITGHAEMDVVIEGIKAGARDFLRKPIQLEELHACLQRTRRYQEVRQERDQIQKKLTVLQRSGSALTQDVDIIGESQAIQRVLKLVDKVAQTDQTTVLIQGETGTGKELVARAIHQQSARASMPFVSLNCTTVPENLLESELFGHEAGAFTDARTSHQGLFELADGGTLFLDEIGDMDLSAQSKMLRVLEEKSVRRLGGSQSIPVDLRVISATNQDLKAQVDQGTFRQDLYFRLDVFILSLPPLRDRGDDCLLLAHSFLQQYATEMGKNIIGFEPDVEARFKTYPCPGNVRELRNMIERAVILSENSRLQIGDFPWESLSTGQGGIRLDDDCSLDIKEMEELLVRTALRRAGGKLTKAGDYLGINRDGVRSRMKKYGIE